MTRNGGLLLPCATPSRAPMPSSAIASPIEHFVLEAELGGSGLGSVRESGRREFVGRLVDQIAGEILGFADAPSRVRALSRDRRAPLRPTTVNSSICFCLFSDPTCTYRLPSRRAALLRTAATTSFSPAALSSSNAMVRTPRPFRRRTSTPAIRRSFDV